MNLATHNKLWVALVGVLAIIATDVLNLTTDGTTADTLRETIIAVLTLFGLERVPNAGPKQ